MSVVSIPDLTAVGIGFSILAVAPGHGEDYLARRSHGGTVGGSRRASQLPVGAVFVVRAGPGCLGVGGVKATFTIGGSVAGLTGSGLVLRNNGGDPFAVPVAGPFTFPTRVPTGSQYAVTVSAQPPGQTCTVSSASGTVGSANVTEVLVTCSNLPPLRYPVGGSVAGL